MNDLTASDAEAIRLRYLEVDSSNVADVLDKLGMPDQGVHPSFAPYPADAGRLAGWAFTIRGQMVPYALADGDVDKMDACEHLEPGAVSVWSGSGEGICFFGELIALRMSERGCVGALVDGGIRDVAWLGRHGFPVFARYRTPVQSIGRWKVNAFGVPVVIPGATTTYVQVAPGDFVLADDDGAIIVPAGVVLEVLEKAEALGATERSIRLELANGLSLDKALAKFGHV
jgi:4-hydroxy-4-methyl-2-oxoglutarate aldolase